MNRLELIFNIACWNKLWFQDWTFTIMKRTIPGKEGCAVPSEGPGRPSVGRNDVGATDHRDTQLSHRAHRDATVLSANKHAQGLESLGSGPGTG